MTRKIADVTVIAVRRELKNSTGQARLKTCLPRAMHHRVPPAEDYPRESLPPRVPGETHRGL